MKKLINGIIDFRKHSLAEYRKNFSKLAAGQSPDALFIACCDSRVVPNVFASSDPGDLFVLRNIGNIVPPYQSVDPSVGAAIEFSLEVLKVKNIIVCGHSECGAINALLTEEKNATPHHFTHQWLSYACSHEKNDEQHKATLHLDEHLSPQNQLSQVNVLEQLKHLKTYPMVVKALNDKTLQLHGWWFDLTTADVHYYNEAENRFVIIDTISSFSGIE